MYSTTKIEDEEEVEEEAYEYVEEEDDDDFVEKEEYLGKKKSNNNNCSSISSTKSKPQVKRHLTRDKTSAESKEDSVISSNTDIRTAFFKASSKPATHHEKKSQSGSAAAAAPNDDDDDLANEIMRELNQKKKTPAPSRPTSTFASPALNNSYNKPRHVPFSINSGSLSLSPAHKRKLSPLSASGMANNENTNRCSKKRFEPDNVEMASPTATSNSSNTLTDVSNTASTATAAAAVAASIQIKPEPQDYDDIGKLFILFSLQVFI